MRHVALIVYYIGLLIYIRAKTLVVVIQTERLRWRVAKLQARVNKFRCEP